MVNPSAMESRYRDRPESNSRQNFARFTGTRVTRVNSRVLEKNAQSDTISFKRFKLERGRLNVYICCVNHQTVDKNGKTLYWKQRQQSEYVTKVLNSLLIIILVLQVEKTNGYFFIQERGEECDGFKNRGKLRILLSDNFIKMFKYFLWKLHIWQSNIVYKKCH